MISPVPTQPFDAGELLYFNVSQACTLIDSSQTGLPFCFRVTAT
jgi:hypothetical protein